MNILSLITLSFILFLKLNGEIMPQVLSPIHLHEAEEELQNNAVSSLNASLLEFTSKGGTIFRLEGSAGAFQFVPGDMVFPSCSGGNNRSQTVWNLLRPYRDKISLMQPHATQYGFDPYNGKANWLRIKPPQQNDEFITWAGVAKSTKLGWDIFEGWLKESSATEAELAKMLNYYDQTYYRPNVPAGIRRIYITFAKNAHIHLYRLNQANASLDNVVILFFPVEDLIKHPLPEWNTHPGSIKSYIELSSLLAFYLDFSGL